MESKLGTANTLLSSLGDLQILLGNSVKTSHKKLSERSEVSVSRKNAAKQFLSKSEIPQSQPVVLKCGRKSTVACAFLFLFQNS